MLNYQNFIQTIPIFKDIILKIAQNWTILTIAQKIHVFFGMGILSNLKPYNIQPRGGVSCLKFAKKIT